MIEREAIEVDSKVTNYDTKGKRWWPVGGYSSEDLIDWPFLTKSYKTMWEGVTAVEPDFKTLD